MSADSHAPCPKCNAPLIIDQTNPDQHGLDTPVRENYEFYIRDNAVVADYRADCWDCGWHFEFAHTEPITGLA